MKKYNDVYVLYGIYEGKIFNFPLDTIEDITEFLRNDGFTVPNGTFDFEKESRKKHVSWDKDDEPIYTDTLTGLFEPVNFDRGITHLMVNKFRYYNPFYEFLNDTEQIFKIDIPHTQSNLNYIYFITDTYKVFKYNVNDYTVVERPLDGTCIKIMGTKYSAKRLLENSIKFNLNKII